MSNFNGTWKQIGSKNTEKVYLALGLPPEKVQALIAEPFISGHYTFKISPDQKSCHISDFYPNKVDEPKTLQNYTFDFNRTITKNYMGKEVEMKWVIQDESTILFFGTDFCDSSKIIDQDGKRYTEKIWIGDEFGDLVAEKYFEKID